MRHISGLTLRRRGYRLQRNTTPSGPFDQESTSKPPETQCQTHKCLYKNLDGLNNKTEELQVQLSEEDPDILFITATKCNRGTKHYTLQQTPVHSCKEGQGYTECPRRGSHDISKEAPSIRYKLSTQSC